MEAIVLILLAGYACAFPATLRTARINCPSVQLSFSDKAVPLRMGGARASLSMSAAPKKVRASLSMSAVPTKVAVIGAGFGGWGACKALVEGGCDVVLLDTLPDPTSATPYVTPSGKPFEPGTKGFWKDYPNIYKLVEEDLGITPEDIFTPCTNR